MTILRRVEEFFLVVIACLHNDVMEKQEIGVSQTFQTVQYTIQHPECVSLASAVAFSASRLAFFDSITRFAASALSLASCALRAYRQQASASCFYISLT